MPKSDICFKYFLDKNGKKPNQSQNGKTISRSKEVWARPSPFIQILSQFYPGFLEKYSSPAIFGSENINRPLIDTIFERIFLKKLLFLITFLFLHKFVSYVVLFDPWHPL